MFGPGAFEDWEHRMWCVALFAVAHIRGLPKSQPVERATALFSGCGPRRDVTVLGLLFLYALRRFLAINSSRSILRYFTSFPIFTKGRLYTAPIILQNSPSLCLGHSKVTDTKCHVHGVAIDVDRFDESSDYIALRIPIYTLQIGNDSRRKVFQLHNQ
jgi:hypothetical protein